MNYKAMIISILLMPVFLVSFLITDGEARPLRQPCATGDCEFDISNAGYICSLDTLTEQEVGDDPDSVYPYGLISFVFQNTPCTNTSSVTPPTIAKNGVPINNVYLDFYKSSDHTTTLDLIGFVYRKYGPTPDNHIAHWYDFMWDGQTGAVISGNQVVLHFVDGQRGDDDLTVNGVIVDQGGAAQQIVKVPTINEWGMIIFLVFAGLGSVYYMRRQ